MKEMRKNKNIQNLIDNKKDKILIVGHKYSGYEKVEKLLNMAGMSKANDLIKEKLKADRISSTIVSANYLDNDKNSSKISQLEVGSVWDYLGLDLMMSNADHKFWGWSDSEAIHLLNYWKTLDAQIFFIFVYDTPENLLQKLSKENRSLTSKSLKDELKKWYEYNKALLKFHKRNTHCSLFVNSKQMMVNSEMYLNSVMDRTGIYESNIDLVDSNKTTITMPISTEDELYRFFSKQVIGDFPDIIQLFKKIQSIANPSFIQDASVNLSAIDMIQQFNEFNNKKNKELSETTYLFDRKEQQLKKWLVCKNVEDKRIAEQIEKTDKEHLERLFSLQESLEESYLANEKITHNYQNINEEYKILSKKESQLKGWLACKKAEEIRLNNDIEKLKNKYDETINMNQKSMN